LIEVDILKAVYFRTVEDTNKMQAV
jgi:hypothetical protein